MSSTQTMDFGILLNVAFGVFKTELHAHLDAAGYDDVGASFGYVFRLLADGPRNLKQVAENLGITPQGALKVVNDMVAKAYLERSDDPVDGRVKLLSLTPRARKAMGVARRFHQRFERELAERVGPAAAAAARAALEHIVSRDGSAAQPVQRPF